jgi:NADH-quinone oxidoreductase subunit C/D
MSPTQRHQTLVNALKTLPGAPQLTTAKDCYEVMTTSKNVFEVTKILKEKCGFEWFTDLCGVDHLGSDETKRFEVVTHIFSPDSKDRIRIRTPLDEDESIPTLIPLWRGANWYERELWDMYGINVKGHPNLERILTHHQFEGFPLRKDYDPEQNCELTEPLPMHFDPKDRPEKYQKGDELSSYQWINIGPSHPATHGTLRIMAEVDGETIVQSKLEIGYLHRCFEKMAETHKWNQVIPYTDRLNYLSAPMNNVGYCRAVEKMLSIEVPPKAQVMRMILSELSRIIDHLVCIGTNAVDIGALTSFWYCFEPRELVYNLFESLCGDRLTTSLTRIGGQAQELPRPWIEECKKTVKFIEKRIKLIDTLLTKNPIWVSRIKGVCQLNKEDSLQFGFTGPLLRAVGVNYDIRKVFPYYYYDQMDFDIPLGVNGDVYDRYLVRMEEMRQSCKILNQCLKNIPEGPVKVDDKRITLPEKADVYNSIEGLMQHFMLVMHDVQVPKGHIYDITEAANGELGFYIISDGSGRPKRIHCRGPSFCHYQPYTEMINGKLIADAVAGLGSLNIIAGELDR